MILLELATISSSWNSSRILNTLLKCLSVAISSWIPNSCLRQEVIHLMANFKCYLDVFPAGILPSLGSG